MKRAVLFVAMLCGCGIGLFAQEEPSVSIKLNDEERFRFEGVHLLFINPSHHVMIGDSAGMDTAANTLTVENTFLGHKAGNRNQDSWNTFLGARAGEFHLTGNDNVYLGAWAGQYDSAGRYNTFVGANSGYGNKTGQMNTYIGRNAGFASDSGVCNTFVGYNAGRDYHGAGYNTFFGRRAGEKQISGIENTFIGTSAGAECLTGSRNTFIGRGAGINNLDGSGNVYIGYFAGRYDTDSNELIIANSETSDPLIYGEFDNQMFRLNARRMEIKNDLENTIIGDSSGTQVSGYQNVILGTRAGKNLLGGSINTYIGYQAGVSDTSGRGNVFIGMLTGWQNVSGRFNAFVGTNAGFTNTTGRENTYLGTSAGGSNTTGNYNTCLGRRAGLSNETGSGNVFLGYYAGASEMGSNKLYIANSATTEPLIYGDFELYKLKFHADSVQNTGMLHSAGEIRTEQQFNASGNPGITDTINTITDIDFTQQKFKYRTTIYTGGIATFMSLESGWVDTISEYLTPCGEIGLIGEFNDWGGDLYMTRNAYNPDLWTLSVKFTIADDHSSPVDSIVEVKFREDAGWAVSWGSTSFPTGIGTNQYGQNIPVTLDDYNDTTLYFIHFNCRTGEYAFEDLTGYCGDSITDSRDGKKYATTLIGDQCWMAQDLNAGTRLDGGTAQSDNAQIEKYCYDNLESNCTQWGGLYQWPELMQYVTTPGVQGICPAGFHVPTDAEYKILEGNVDSQYGPGSTEWNKIGFRGYDAGFNLRAAEGWNGTGNGSDAFGFHSLPGGYYVSSGEAGFYDSGCCNNYFTSTLDALSNMAYIRHMNGDVGSTIMRNTNSTTDGGSLRCLKD